MRRQYRFAIAFAAGVTAALGVLPAAAAEYCVTCAGPAAMYACTIEGAPNDAAADPRMQLLCIQELARQGGHETCSVPRSAPTPCPGVIKVVAVPDGLAPVKTLPVTTEAEGAAPAPDAAAPADQTVPKTTPAAKPAKEPRTVEELANQTVEASKKGLKKAGDAVTGTAEKAGEGVQNAGSAVGNAAKKTWHCLKSLFSDC